MIYSIITYELKDKFNKVFVFNELKDLNIEFSNKVYYLRFSKKNVIRGIHFQSPPHDHQKLVSCIEGKVLDVFVDIRKSSKTFGKFQSIELNENDNRVSSKNTKVAPFLTNCPSTTSTSLRMPPSRF